MSSVPPYCVVVTQLIMCISGSVDQLTLKYVRRLLHICFLTWENTEISHSQIWISHCMPSFPSLMFLTLFYLFHTFQTDGLLQRKLRDKITLFNFIFSLADLFSRFIFTVMSDQWAQDWTQHFRYIAEHRASRFLLVAYKLLDTLFITFLGDCLNVFE